MRERLSSARQSSDLTPEKWAATTIAASATASKLGLLLSRALDNHDIAATKRAVVLLAWHVRMRHKKLHPAYAREMAWTCVKALLQPLCGVCMGRKYIHPLDAVPIICGDCGGSGRHAARVDERVMVVALAALRGVREEVTKKLGMA